jgi:hypothetical protein
VQHSRFVDDAWSAAVSTKATTALPPAAAINSTGDALELITVGTDGGVRHSRFVSNAWKSPTLLKATTALPPALVDNPAGGLELAVVGANGTVSYAHFAGSSWSSFQTTAVKTTMIPALAVDGDGVVNLVATAPDQTVVHSRLVNKAWTTPVSTGLRSTLSPTLVFNRAGSSLELLARGPVGTVQHGRFTSSAWATPVSLDLGTEVRPVLAATSADVAAAVVGTDGQVSTSRFQAPAAPVSFKTDILRIFTNNGTQTCSQSKCHSGNRPSGDLNLTASQAYKNIVNVTSHAHANQKRVVPGDADNSYLFQQVDSGTMPKDKEPLSSADIDLLRRWIEAGAPNN